MAVVAEVMTEVSQEVAVASHLFSCGIFENVMLGRHSPNAAEQSLHRLDLNALLTAQPNPIEGVGQLSGGERQGVCIARAMVPPDAALFLDEPTTALDAGRRANIVSWLHAKARERQVMVFATHDSDLAQIADYVLRLSQGRLVSFTPQEDSLHRVKQQA